MRSGGVHGVANNATRQGVSAHGRGRANAISMAVAVAAIRTTDGEIARRAGSKVSPEVRVEAPASSVVVSTIGHVG